MQKRTPLRLLCVLIPLAVLVGHPGCGGGSGSSPTAPTASVPAPAATPEQTSPSAAPLSACDRLPKVESKSACGDWGPTLTGQVSDAIDRVVANYPSIFEPGSTNDRGDQRIIDQNGYFRAVVSELDKAEVCAGWNPGDIEVQVTTSNDSSDRFRVMTGTGYPWRGKATYIDSCKPAALPKAVIDHTDLIFVTAYGARCDPGADAKNPFTRGSAPQIPMGCEAFVTATPKTFGGLDVPLSVHGSEIVWEHVSGHAVFWQWEDQPFNIVVSPRDLGPLKICATVQSVTGCMNATVVE